MGKSNQPQDHSNRVTASERLDSWKEIAVYLKRGVTTVQRWEKHEGLPVHRLPHHKRGTAYAYKSELDDWLGKRSTTSGPGWLRFFSENRKTVVGVAGGITLFLLVGLVAWMETGSSPDLEVLDFQERDWVLIADFENRTGEAAFDGVLEYALEREIANSQFVNVVPRERIEDTLRLMRRPLDTPIDRTLAREISLRDGGIKALLTGRVEKLGSTYLLSVQVVDPSQGQAIASASEEAAGQKQVLSALRSLSHWSREALGEKLASILESEERLERVTTPSLRALQLFTKADALIAQWRHDLAEKLLKQAVDIDPAFASAHMHLAHAIRNQRKPAEEYLPYAEKAFQLAETTGDRERYFIHGSYYSMKGEQERAVQAYETLLSFYPDHFWAATNLAGYFGLVGDDQRALTYLLRRADLRPTGFFSNASVAEKLIQLDGDLIRAQPYLDRARNLISPEMFQGRTFFWTTRIMLYPAYEAWLDGNPETVLVEIEKVLQTLQRLGMSDRRVPALGNLYRAVGKRQLARQWLTKGLERRSLHLTLATISYAEGDHKAVTNHLKQYLETTKVSGGPRPWVSIEGPFTAIMAARSGFFSESEKMLVELREKTKDTSELPPGVPRISSEDLEMARGVLKLSRGDTAEGIAILESTLPLLRNHYLTASEILAEAYRLQGDLVKTIQLLEQASTNMSGFLPILHSPLWLRIQAQLAQLYREMGRDAEARKIEEKLRNLLAYADPDHPILRQLDRTGDVALIQPLK